MIPTTPFDRVVVLAKDKYGSEAKSCEAAGLDRTVIANARRGRRSFDLPTLQKFATAFDVPLSQLLGEASAPAAIPGGGMIVFRPLDRLDLSPKNERTSFDQVELVALSEDIAQRGLLQNLVIYPHPDIADMDLVAGGGRRWRAMRLLAANGQLPEPLAVHGIPCRRLADEREALVATIVENMRREDVHFLDRAAAFARLRDELGWSNTQIGQSVNLGNDAVGQYLRVHDRLDEDMRAAARRGELNFKQARELVAEKRESQAVAADCDDALFDHVVMVLSNVTQIAETDIYEDDDLTDNLHIAGSEQWTLLSALREEFHIPVGRNDLTDGNIKTVADLVRHVQSIVEAGKGGQDTARHGGMTEADIRERGFCFDVQTNEQLTTLWWERRRLTAESFAAMEKELKRRGILPCTTSFSYGPKGLPEHVRQKGEQVFPLGDFAFMGQMSSGATGTLKLWFEERATGRRFVATPEQSDHIDIEEAIAVKAAAAEGASVAVRVRSVLAKVGGFDASSPILDIEYLAAECGVHGPAEAIELGEALAEEFGFARPPFVVDPDVPGGGLAEIGLATVGDLVAFLEKRLAHAGAGE